jgi:hypothetical protein
MKALKKINGLIIAVLIATVMLLAFPTVGADEFDTTVSIEPASQTVDAGETFTVNISCVPGQPVKGYEFKMSFDASLLQANSVVEGDIFDGYTTFFNAGTINNNAGSIVDMYNLIVGAGNVSELGTFVTISFTAKTISGVSQLHLYSVGVCDENGYLSTVITDGDVTVNGTYNPPSPPPPSGPPGLPPENPGNDTEENNPPASPLAISGPTFVEMGVEYGYTVSTTDPDGDGIRYRFDWGDGILSEWSELADSGVTAALYHSWMAVDTYQVRAIAQDEHGLNSSWSALLNVTVSGVDAGNETPVANIVVPDNLFANQTIVFDASASFDPDGIIVSYLWDFGDGTTGAGVKPVHEYTRPGTYLVTLVITDNSGNTYTKQITINVAAGTDVAESELQQHALSINLPLVLVGSAIAVLLCLAVVFRNRIQMFVLDYQISSLSQYDSHNKKQIKKAKAKPKK